MTGNQKKIWPLLRELIQICEEEGIPWFMSGRTAIRCVLSGEPFYKSFLDVEITVPAWYARRLIAGIEGRNRPGRILEGLYNSAWFPGLYLKYVNTDTTLFPVNEGFSSLEKGMFVKVCFLRGDPGPAVARRARELEGLIHDTAGLSVPPNMPGGKRVVFYGKRRLGGVRYSRKLFDDLLDIYSTEREQVLINGLFGETHTCPADRFLLTETWCWQDTVLRLPAGAKEYCRMIAGEDWRACQDDVILEGVYATMIVPGANNQASSKVPYTQLLPIMKKAGLTKRLVSRRIRTIGYNAQHKELSHYSTLAWRLAQRAGDLIQIRDIYAPQMEKIHCLVRARQMDEVKEILEEYDLAVRKYADLEMGFCWNEELQKTYIFLLRTYGEEKFARRAEELVRKDPQLTEQLERLSGVKKKEVYV